MDYGRRRSRNNSGSFEDILQDFTTYLQEPIKLNSHKVASPTKSKPLGLQKDALVVKYAQLYEN
jgi:hypothetical protein